MKKRVQKFIAFTLILCDLFQATGVYALTKDEHVYVKLNEQGEVKNTSIIEHLFDYDGNTIYDKTLLSDIKNLNGNENYTQHGNDLIWETKGNDIYYQGTYQENLPITLDVKYYLDDEETSINEMLGKKGHVKIVLTYTNHLYKTMNMNGQNEKIYVPYGIVTTTILNNTDHKNIEVTNGKVLDNGVSSIVMAISSPGLNESLKLEDFNDMNHVEIQYDTESFELNSIYSVATTNLFDESNFDLFGRFNDLYHSINLLQNNMNSIVEASKNLSEGSSQMDAGMTELNAKIQELVTKYQSYRNRDKNDLKEEFIKIVESNLNSITPALEEEITAEASRLIKENKEELEKAVIDYAGKNTKEVVEKEVSKIVSELDLHHLMEQSIHSNLYHFIQNDPEIVRFTTMLQEDLKNELKQIVFTELNEFYQSLDDHMSEIQEKDVQYMITNYGLSEEQAKEIVSKVQTDTLLQVKKNVEQSPVLDRIISAFHDDKSVSNLVSQYVTQLNQRLSESLNKDATIEDYSKTLKDKIIISIKQDLEEGNLYFEPNAKGYLSGVVDQIIDRTSKDLSKKYTHDYTNRIVKKVIHNQFDEANVDSKLREVLNHYENDLDQKVMVLDDSIQTLSDSLNQLNDGSNQLSAGMNALWNGLDQYNREGIHKLNGVVNGDVKNFQQRLDALRSLSQEYQTIDITPSHFSGHSTIVFMIDSVAKMNVIKPDVIGEEKKSSLWDKITGLFQ